MERKDRRYGPRVSTLGHYGQRVGRRRGQGRSRRGDSYRYSRGAPARFSGRQTAKDDGSLFRRDHPGSHMGLCCHTVHSTIQEAVIGWLRGSSTGTLRKGPGTVTPSLHDASRDAITLAQLAGDRLFASDLKHGQGASLRAARAEVCSCGSGPCDWWHYFVSCTAARAKREELFQQLHAAAQRAPLRLGRDILAAGRVDAPRRQPSFRGGRDGTQARHRRRGRVHSHLLRSSCACRCGGQSRSCHPRPCAARQRY